MLKLSILGGIWDKGVAISDVRVTILVRSIVCVISVTPVKSGVKEVKVESAVDLGEDLFISLKVKSDCDLAINVEYRSFYKKVLFAEPL